MLGHACSHKKDGKEEVYTKLSMNLLDLSVNGTLLKKLY